jgi:UDP-glucose 4-epimerase
MKVLITGGAGFIGSHLAEAYLNAGHEVYIIDDLSTGRLENITHLQKDEHFKNRFFVHICSIFNHETLLELVGICDLVFHLAAAVGVKYILDNPLDSIVTNIRGTENVLSLCNKFRKKVIIASTSEVYGKHTHAPLVETDNIIYGCTMRSRWSYAATKLVDEFTALAYYKTKNLPVTVVRLFNTIGPRQTGRYGMVIPRFVRQALRAQPVTVFGDGTQTRTFTHVKDVVKALMLLSESKEALGEIVNIGGNREISIKDAAKMIISLTNSRSSIKFIPYEEAYEDDFEDMARRVPSVEKLQKLINFIPETKLEDIINDVIEFARS